MEHDYALPYARSLGCIGIISAKYILMVPPPTKAIHHKAQHKALPRLRRLGLLFISGAGCTLGFYYLAIIGKIPAFQTHTYLSLLCLGLLSLWLIGLVWGMGWGVWHHIHQLAARYRTLHSFIGIGCGSLLAIAFLAGTLTLCAAPLQDWSTPSFPAPARTSSIPLDAIPNTLTQLIREHTLDTAHLISPSHYRLILEGPSAAQLSFPLNYDLPLGLPAQRIIVSSAPPYKPQLYRLIPSAVPVFIGGLHRRMGLPIPEMWSLPLIGSLCLLYSLALLSGIIILLPGMWRSLMTVRLQGHVRRLWLDLHSLLGLSTLPFQLVIALTSALFTFFPLISTLPLPTHAHHIHPIHAPSIPPAAAVPLTPAHILARVRDYAPTFQPFSLDYALSGRTETEQPQANILHAPLYSADAPTAVPHIDQPYVLIRGTDQQHPLIGRDNGSVLLNPYTGALLTSQNLPGHQSAARHLLTWCLALHFGSFGGNFMRWVYIILGLCGVGFFHTANQLWINAHRLKKTGTTIAIDTPATQWVASLSEGSLMGCMLGLASLILLSPMTTHIVPLPTAIAANSLNHTYQNISLFYYGICGATIGLYTVLPRHICRILTCGLASACLLGAVSYVLYHNYGTVSHNGMPLTAIFTIAGLSLGGYALYTLRRTLQKARTARNMQR